MPRPQRTLLCSLLTLALATAQPARALEQLPDLGDPAASSLSVVQERSLGERSMAQLRAAGGVLDDPEVNAYLQQLGMRLVASDPATAGQSFEFFAVPDDAINAFAMPGGHIGIHLGLLMATDNESELAAVMAHEISHVTQRHVARQLEAASGSQMASLAALLAGIVAAASGQTQVASAAIAGATAGHLQSQLNYSRDHEREADRIGFSLLVRAGFDPAAMASFFRRMQQLTAAQDSAAPEYLRSHPLTTERIADAEDRALSARYRQVPDSTDYRFVRALVRSYHGEPEQAVAQLTQRLARADDADRTALRYGLAAAQLRARDFEGALGTLAALDASGAAHPMIEALAGQVLMQAGRLDAAIDRYQRALARFPEHRQLIEDYPRALLRANRYQEATAFLSRRIEAGREDAPLHLLAAEANAGLGQRLSSHYHQGEAYAAMGNLPAAIEQLQIALRSKGGDDITRQIAESRLRTLRDDLRQQRKAPGEATRAGLGYGSLPAFTHP
ncbi:MAG: M48 family metallopeptidase [Rhodocyclaceae bacterium]|nr:M48 family metallopeptidase [Rhodocyclaceae bacterium]